MGYLKYPAYVEVGRRSRSYSLYIYVCDFKKFWHLEYDYLEYPGYVKVVNGPDNILPRLSRGEVNFPVCLSHTACRFLVIPARGNSPFFNVYMDFSFFL